MDIHHHIHDHQQGSRIADLELAVGSLIDLIHSLKETMMATQDELVTRIEAANTKLDKVGTEVTGLKTAFEELKAAQGGEVTPAVDAAMTKMEEKLNNLDLINEDAAA